MRIWLSYKLSVMYVLHNRIIYIYQWYVYIYFRTPRVEETCLVSNDVLKEAERHVDRGEKAAAYRFMLCQFHDAVESPTGRMWKKCVEDLDLYITNHLGIQFWISQLLKYLLVLKKWYFTCTDFKLFFLLTKSIGYNCMYCLF